MILGKKKDEGWRFCVDFRALNAITVKNAYPIPTIDEIFEELKGTHYFSKIDLQVGFHTIHVAPN